MKLIRQQFNVTYSFPVIFTRDAFGVHNRALADVLTTSGRKRNRMLIAVDSNVVDANPELLEKIERYGQRNRELLEFADTPFVIRGGEACKNEPLEVEKIRALTDKHHICRHSFILAIGGGAVLDAAGYAAATAHRGIRLIRMPTTPLAQNDAGVGVKNGVNAFGKKNYLGTFAPPYAVINDFDFLATVPARHMRAGIAEAVKVALIRDGAFFDWLYRERGRLAALAPEIMEKMIVRCAELHLEHISRGGDPFERGASRPLDFGHWSAHGIEELSSGDVNHGEAVAVGIALDSLYAFRIGLISELEQKKIFITLEDAGFDLYHWTLGWLDVGKALEAFKEHLGGDLTITLPDGIGRKRDIHDVDMQLMRDCIEALSGRKKGKERGYDAAEQKQVRLRDT